HAQLLLVPERVSVSELRLCRSSGLYDADHPHRWHDSPVPLSSSASGRNAMKRIAAYLTLIMLGIIGLAPFLYLALLSTKRRIEILSQVPPNLNFSWTTIGKTYTEVLYSQGMLDFTVNSVVVVGAATLLALIIGTPAAYAFSRMKVPGEETLANTILS